MVNLVKESESENKDSLEDFFFLLSSVAATELSDASLESTLCAARAIFSLFLKLYTIMHYRY